MKPILDGIRVLDFGRYMAGPYCGALLADLGAQVIRIERVEGGEDRFDQYPMNEQGIAASFLALNRNKLGMTLNPMHPDAPTILQRLVASADVVIANLPENSMQRMGIDYEALRAIKADIILAAISAFGDSGPYSDRVGLDGLAQAMSGAAYLSGQPGTPSKSFAPWADILAGTFAAFGTLAAIRHRDQTGEGQRVGADLLTTGIAALSWIHTEQAATQINRTADGNRTQSSAPGDIFRSLDGWVLMQTIGRALFERWAHVVGEPEWLNDPRFANDISRSNNRKLLCERTQKWVANLTTDEAIQQLSAARIPCGPVLSPQQVLDDAHVKASLVFDDMDYPGLQHPAKIMRHPVRFSASSTACRYRAPLLGEHTEQLMAELGFGRDEIGAYRQSKVI